jgi:pimeloyl-ACP methyl ester carboxylesterase
VVFVTPGPQPITITYRLTVVSGAYAQAPPEASPGTSTNTGIVEWSVDVGGRTLHAACAGSGSPAVFLDQGGPQLEPGTSFITAVGPDIAAALGTRFCAYDRAGTGQSDPDPMGVRTLKEAATDMNAVLASPELGCPCVVVGTSLGAAIALTALVTDPAGFGGLVLLDSPPPGYIDAFLALVPAGAPDAGPEFMAYNGGENEERLDIITGYRQLAAPATPPAIPIIVVTHGAGYPPPCNWDPPCSAEFPVDELEATWQAGQRALAEALAARLVVAEGTGHSIADENPELVIGLVAEVVAAVRDPSARAAPSAGPAA